MDAHKRAIFAAWRAHPLWGYEGSETDLLQGHPPFVLGGRAVERQVMRLLREELKLARLELEASNERARGSEWWETYIEEPAEHDLKETLAFSVPRRPKESKDDYARRLELIARAYRARLPTYERRGLSLADEEEA